MEIARPPASPPRSPVVAATAPAGTAVGEAGSRDHPPGPAGIVGRGAGGPADPAWRLALARAVAFGRREITVLSILLVVALSLFAFLSIADEVAEGGTHAFDEALLLALRAPGNPQDPLGPGWLEQAAGDITALGGTTVITLVTLAVIGFLLIDRKPRTAGLVIVSVGGGMLVSTLLKLGFDRPRPDLVPHAVEVYTASFPSGHAMGAAVAYLTLGGLVSWSQPRARAKAYVLTLAVLLTVAIGVSRVYLGVHWPTDVMAGWSMGAAWALGWSAIAIVISRRGSRSEG